MKKLLLSLAFLLLFCRPAAATIAATGQQCNAAAGAATVSCTVTVTSGNTVFLIGIVDIGTTIADATASGCSDNQSNVYKPVILTNGSGGMKVCSSALTHTASTTFTWNPSAGAIDLGIVVVEFSGLVTATPSLDVSVAAGVTTGTNSASGTTLTTTTADQVVLAGMDVRTSGTLACPSGYTQIAEDESWVHVSYSTCYKIISSTGTQQATWTSPSGNAVNFLATFSATTTGLTGSDIRFSGHSCTTIMSTAGRVAFNECVMPYASGSLVGLVGRAFESKIGTTDNAGCSDSDSNTYTYGIMHNNAAGGGVKVCYFLASADGQAAFRWTNQGGNTFAGVTAFEVFGSATSSILDVTALNDSGAGNSANATTGTTGTTANAKEFIVTALTLSNNDGVSCGAGYSAVDTRSNSCYKVTSATGTQTMTYTSTSGNWQAAILAFNPAGGGGGGSTFSALTLALGDE